MVSCEGKFELVTNRGSTAYPSPNVTGHQDAFVMESVPEMADVSLGVVNRSVLCW